MQKSFGGNYDRKLFAKLRKLQSLVAGEENIPPYVAFNDAIADRNGGNRCQFPPVEMLSVNGVGMRKPGALRERIGGAHPRACRW